MKKIDAFRLLGLAGLASLVTLPSYAQDRGYYYGGLSLGQSRATIDEDRITANLLARGLTTRAMDFDERSIAYKAFGGYQFNQYFAVEGGYFNLGKFGFTSTTVPAGTLDGRMKVQGLNLDVVGTLPLTERLSAIGRVGAQYASTRDTFRGSGAVGVSDPSPSKRAANYKVGLGLQYAFSPSFLVRGEGERYRINDAVGNRGDVNVFTVSLVFPFGRAPSPAPQPLASAVYAPPPPAPVATPAPAVAPAPLAPVATAPARHRVSFSADSLFGFDESAVRPEGRSELDRIGRELADTQFDVVTVEGHTDRLGSRAYNEKLSLKRAEAVKAYLVTSGGLNPAKVSAVGMGASNPVTKPGDCKGSTRKAELIACLQPDRRVEVEVAGTR